MKKIVLLFTVALFAVAFVSCSKEYLFQNIDKEIMAGLSDAEKHSADSNNKVPDWVCKKVNLKEYKILKTLSLSYKINYSFITEDFYKKSKKNIYKNLDNICKQTSSSEIDNVDKADLFIIPNIEKNVSPHTNGATAQTEIIGKFDDISVYCSFSNAYILGSNYTISILNKRFYAGPLKYKANLEGVGLIHLSNGRIEIAWSGLLSYEKGEQSYEKIVDCTHYALRHK